MKIKYLALLTTTFLLIGCKDNSEQKPDNPKPEPAHYEVVTVQPLYSSLLDRCKDDTILGFPEGVENEPDLIIRGAENLASNLSNVSYRYENNLKDKVIGKDTFEKFGKNQIISIQSHGDYVDPYIFHETIVTGADYIEEEISEADEDKIVESTMWNEQTGHSMSAITAEFVKAYCPDLSGSIVYMGQCHGGHDFALAYAFLDKGAVAVYGASDAIHMHYGDMMQYRVTSLLGEVNPTTNNYYTTGEALLKAQEEYGIDDKVKYGGAANGARMLLYGDQSYKLANK